MFANSRWLLEERALASVPPSCTFRRPVSSSVLTYDLTYLMECAPITLAAPVARIRRGWSVLARSPIHCRRCGVSIAT